MTRPEILDHLKALLQQNKKLKIDLATVTEETRIVELGFDSLSILDFIYEIESRFQIETDPAELVELERVRQLVDYIGARVKP